MLYGLIFNSTPSLDVQDDSREQYISEVPATYLYDKNGNPLLRNTDRLLVARNPAMLEQPMIENYDTANVSIRHPRVWADDINSFVDVLK